MKKFCLLVVAMVVALLVANPSAVAFTQPPVEASTVLNALLRQPQWIGDRSDTPADRIALYWPVALAIAHAAKTPYQAAALVALSGHETHLARPVVEGRCSDMPKGQRCDGGKARGVFQLHKEACRAAFEYEAGSPESLEIEAVCALRHLGFAMKRCRDVAVSPEAGMFSAYRNGWCGWAPAAKRAATMEAVLRSWRSI